MARLACSPLAVRLYRARARAMLPFNRPLLWLDVGTGHGHFCAEARRIHQDTEFHGLDWGEGVEIAARNDRIARAYRGSFVGLVGQLACQYDVVSMHHYLEHTLAPRQELAAAHTALRPGGHLLVEVPDPESASARLLGQWWGPWLQPQHLHFIPLDNLCSALAEQGFSVVATDRREPHVPTDLTSAAVNMLKSVLPGEDLPWLPEQPGPLSRWARRLSLLAVAPVLLVLVVLDLLLAPSHAAPGCPTPTGWSHAATDRVPGPLRNRPRGECHRPCPPPTTQRFKRVRTANAFGEAAVRVKPCAVGITTAKETENCRPCTSSSLPQVRTGTWLRTPVWAPGCTGPGTGW